MPDSGPTFVLSLDTELVWGSFDQTSESRFELDHPDMRGIIQQLLSLLAEFEISATWALVGHLFLSSCERGLDGRAHPNIERPTYRWFPRDWFGDDPCSDRSRRPLWYGDDIVDLILDAPVPQEIGSHSFSHIVFGDPGCSPKAAADDLSECVQLAASRGLTLQSFVFPRNREGHHTLLAEHGFRAYRGEDPAWFHGFRGPVRRASHLLDQAAALPPPVSAPQERLPGLWNIPGSMLLLHRVGARRLVPFGARVAKAKAGLNRAVRDGKVFHLWTHPENMARDRDGMFQTLRAILSEVARLRERGALVIETMGALATRLSGTLA